MSALLIGAIVVALICVAGLGRVVAERRAAAIWTAGGSRSQRAATGRDAGTAGRAAHDANSREANQRFDAALRASGVTVMTQDRDLVFTWISRGMLGSLADDIIGKPQQEVVPEAGAGGRHQSQARRHRDRANRRAAIFASSHDGRRSLVRPHRASADGRARRVTGIIAGAIDITRYKEQEGRIRLLMRELTHRSKNLLTVIQAIMRQTASNSTSLDGFRDTVLRAPAIARRVA